MSLPNYKYRCAGCQQLKSVNNMKMISWYRTPKYKSRSSESMGFCRQCATKQASNETGRALANRLGVGYE